MAAMGDGPPGDPPPTELQGDTAPPHAPKEGVKQEILKDSPSKGLDSPCLTCGSPGGNISVFTRVGNKEPLLTLLGLTLRRPAGDIHLHSDVVCDRCFTRFQLTQRLMSRLAEVSRQTILSFNRAVRKFSRTPTTEGSREEECLLVLNGVDMEASEGGIVGRALALATTKRADQGGTKGTAERKFSCPVCSKKFRAYSHRVEHMLVHTGERPFRCGECGFLATTKSNLARHQQRHGRGCECHVCGKKLCNKFTLKEHLKTHGTERPHQCQHCDKTFLRRRDLWVHEQGHGATQGQDLHRCQVCHRSFVLRSRLERHMLVHGERKQHQCQVCQKEFARKDDLKCHQRIHTGEKPYSCEHCGKAFRYISNCRSHMRVHQRGEGGTQWQCARCNMTFPTEGKFTAHLSSRNHRKRCEAGMGVGTGARAGEGSHVSCEGCGAPFSPADYALHRATCPGNVTGGVEEGHLACGVCGLAFKGMEQLSEHALTSHVEASDLPPPGDTNIVISDMGEGGLVSLAQLEGVNVVVAVDGDSPTLRIPIGQTSPPATTNATLLPDDTIIEVPPARSSDLLPLNLETKGTDESTSHEAVGTTVLADLTEGGGVVVCEQGEGDHHHPSTPASPPAPTITILNPGTVFKVTEWDLNQYYHKT